MIMLREKKKKKKKNNFILGQFKIVFLGQQQKKNWDPHKYNQTRSE